MLMMNPRRHKRMSAGAMVAVMAGVGAAIVSERGARRAATTTDAVRDTVAVASDGTRSSPILFVLILLLVLGLAFGVLAFIRSQNTSH